VKRILLVDDEPFNLIPLEGILNMNGVNAIDTAFDGTSALDILMKNP
jgi:PleD family two-component response regulator